MIHTQFFSLVVSEQINTYLPGGGHFEFYARWPPEIDHNLFAMVFETSTPIPTTMPNLKNLALSARFGLYLVYSCPATTDYILGDKLESSYKQTRHKMCNNSLSKYVIKFLDPLLQTSAYIFV